MNQTSVNKLALERLITGYTNCIADIESKHLQDWHTDVLRKKINDLAQTDDTTPSVSDQPNIMLRPKEATLSYCEGERGGKSPLAATPKNPDSYPC